MGMYTQIIGVRSEEDPEYKKHKAIYDLCVLHGVSLPAETDSYFKLVDSPKDVLKSEFSVPYKKVPGDHDMQDCWEVTVADIPPGITKIRFTNNY